LESCHSGGFAKEGPYGLPKAGKLILTACTDSETAFEPWVKKNGMFTYFIVEGASLTDGRYPADSDNDLKVSAEEMFSYAEKETVRWRLNLWQHPQISDRVSGEVELSIRVAWKGLEWMSIAGSWTIGDDIFEQTNSGVVAWAFGGDSSWKDYEVEVKVKFLGGAPEASVGVRSPDTKNVYYFCLAGGARVLTIAKIIEANESYRELQKDEIENSFMALPSEKKTSRQFLMVRLEEYAKWKQDIRLSAENLLDLNVEPLLSPFWLDLTE
jgi:hypothetical protein